MTRGGSDAGATTIDPSVADRRPTGDHGDRLAFVLVWSASEPDRVGELFFPPPAGAGRSVCYGRGGVDPAADVEMASFVQQRPTGNVSTGGPSDPTISRRQLLIRAGDGAWVSVDNVGRGELRLNGVAADRAVVRPGDVLEIADRAVFLCGWRPAVMPDTTAFPQKKMPAFGRADDNGVVGESAAAWTTRDQAAVLATLPQHVLVLGPSGAGKELVARAIHAGSPRAARRLVSRNAATIPEGIADAEIFGNAKNYPNPGMPGRLGLIGEADRSTLFLDEIGELSDQLQSHLLRMLDSDGEYQRLGESQVRRADVRVIGATNRPLAELRHDLVPRFTLRLRVTGLNERRDDIPLLVRHLLGTARADSGAHLKRVSELQGEGVACVDPALMTLLLRHRYTHHVRELDTLLWLSLTTSRGPRLVVTPAVLEEVQRTAEQGGPQVADGVTREMLLASLRRHDGVQEKVWRELGLSSRFVLRRLMKKLGVELDKHGQPKDAG